MGGVTTAWDQAGQEANARLLQRRAQHEQERVEQQNTVGAQLLDAINNASNIKPQIKDENGNLIHNPEYDNAQDAKTKLLQQYTALNSPEQHASFAQHLHGLIFGHPDHRMQQPALSPNSSPNDHPEPQFTGGMPTSPAAPPEPQHPMTPLPADHPANKITAALKGLKEHLSAAAHPLPAQPKPDLDLVAKYYRDPGQVQHERTMEMWGQRGENAIKVAEIRKEAIMESLKARPPRLLSQTTIPDLLEQMKVDPTMSIYGPEGNELSPAQLSEMPAGTIAREFRAGSQIFYALGDQNSKTLKVGNQVYDIPSVGPITPGNSTPLGVASPGTTSTQIDPFGLKTTTERTPATPGMAGAVAPGAPAPTAAPVAAPTATPVPTLKTRLPVSSAAPSLANVNAQIATANAASPKLNKGKPVSTAAPLTPSAQTLDQDGHIPAGVGNDLVRQYANNILDGRDPKEIPNPKAQAAALALVDKFVPGYSRGAFTPREKVQFQTATTFLHQLQDSDALKVLDSYISREKLARAMKAPEHMSFIDRLAAFNLNAKEAEFLRDYQVAVGTVQGLAGITRAGRATNVAVQRLMTELPNVFNSPDSKDAKARIDNLLKEADIALHTNPRDVGKSTAPVSKNAPKLGQWKPPADAPPAPKEDGKVLKADGNVIAISKGGNWTDPNAH